MTKRIIGIFLALLMLVPMFSFMSSAADEVISVGKKYTLEYSTPIDNAYPKLAYKSEKKLTDGARATQASYSDSAFLKLYRGTSVAVTIDLESVMAVNAVSIGQLQQKTAGIICSRYLEVYVSEDGENYGFAGRTENRLLATDGTARCVTLKATLDKTYKARYVRAVFSSDIFTYVDEVSVFGGSDISSAESAPKYESDDKNEFVCNLDEIKSMCLMYIASYYSTDMIKPYFAYIDANGKATDVMFDSLLFLGMPETAASDGYMRQADMQSFVSKVMSPDFNMGALNTVVGQLKSELGLPEDYKYPVFLSVPFVGYFTDAFGEIDGVSISASTLENRSKIVKWYIDYAEQAYQASNFTNLELRGFYWFAEGINHQLSTHESELVKYFNDYTHEKGYKTMWIPYYSSAGIDEAMDLGFDSVTMQSGLAFGGGEETGKPNAEVCKDAAQAAKRLGLSGIEFEVDIYRDDYAKNLAKYVSAAYGAGVMENGMITMYQSGTHLYNSANNMGTTREIYELTYNFISGNYKEAAPVIKEGATLTMKVESFANGRLEVSDADNKKSELKIAHIEKPEGLYFFAEGNGYFEAQSYDCQPGTYTARLSVTDGNNVSNTVEITIIVEPADETEESDASSDPAGGDNNGGNTLMIILIAVGAVLVIGAVVAVLKIRSSKKDKN